MQAKAISQTNFQKYGTFINPNQIVPAQDEVNYSYIPGIEVLSGEPPYRINFLKCKKRPIEVCELERHVHTKEVLISLSPETLIIAVAAAGDAVQEPDIECFLIPPHTAVIFNEGVWHYLPFPLTGDCNCFVLYRKGTEETDMEMVSLSKTYSVSVSEPRC